MKAKHLRNTPRLHVEFDEGSGPTIVLLHGLMGDASQWRPVIEDLQNDFRVVAVDLLGHGQSIRSNTLSYDVDEQVSALRRTLEFLDVSKPISLVGYSIGGTIAAHYSALYREEIEQLYLISTPFYLRPEQMVASNFAASALASKISDKLLDSAEALLSPGRILYKLVARNPRPRTIQDIIGAADSELDARVIRLSLQHLVRDFDFCNTLAQVSTPTTFIVGRHDPFIIPSQLEALKRYSPFMSIERVSSISFDHFLVQHLPIDIAACIKANTRKTLHIGCDKGSGSPVVLLHGIESSSTYWYKLASSLSKERRVIAIDLLGFGASPAPQNIAYDIHDHISWLENTIHDLGLEKFELVGHSLGATVGLAYAARFPQAITRLSLLSPVLTQAQRHSHNALLRNLRLFYHLSDTSYMYSYSSRIVGESRVRGLIPSMRTIQYTINRQQPMRSAAPLSAVPITIAFGQRDRLVDQQYIATIAKRYENIQELSLPRQGHNFPLFDPNTAYEIITGHPPAESISPSSRPPSFTKQLLKLAAPSLFLLSISYTALGLFLLTEYAPYILSLGLLLYVLKKSADVLKIVFSWQFQALAYTGYVLLGLFGFAAVYLLIKSPQLAAVLSIYTISAILLLTGATRLYAANYWSRTVSQRRLLLASGIPLVLLGILSVIGSIWSLFILPSLIAAIMLFRGFRLGIYTVGVVTLAYIRGYSTS